MAYISHAFVGNAAVGVVGAYEYAVCSVFEIESLIVVVVGLEVCAIALGIDNAKVCANPHRARKLFEKPLEVVDSAARGKSHAHHDAFAVDPVGLVGRQIVCHSVHYCESGIVHAHPCFVEI